MGTHHGTYKKAQAQSMLSITIGRMRLSSVAVTAVLFIAILVACGGSETTQINRRLVAATPFPKEQASQPVGVPAIQPTHAGSVPAYTLADAQQYILCHPLPRNLATAQATLTQGQTCDQQSFTIVLLQFSTSDEVSKLLNGEPTGLPANTLLCYVALSGQFTFPGPRGKVVSYQVGFEVFDGKTGNRLMSGGLARVIPTPTPIPIQ